MEVAEAPPSLPSPTSPLSCKKTESAIFCYSPAVPPPVDENSRIRVRQFPSRLLLHIFSYLRPKELTVVIQTCRAWRSAGAKQLWKYINLSGKINFENYFFVSEFLVRYADVVEILNVSNNSSVDDKMIRLILQNCKRLKDLNISNTSVTSWGLIPIYQQTFCSVNTLEKLDISNTAKLKSVLSYPKNLKELNMAEACEGSGYLQCYKLVTLNILGPVRPFIRYITKLTNLQNLCISAAVLKQLPKESWDVLKGRLRRLEIWNVRKTPWKYGENPKDRVLPLLTELKLVNVYFYSAFSRNIETIMPCCPKLKKLVFHQQSGMCDEGAKLDTPIFDMIARCCPLLEELHVPRSALASNQTNQTYQIEERLRTIFSKGTIVVT